MDTTYIYSSLSVTRYCTIQTHKFFFYLIFLFSFLFVCFTGGNDMLTCLQTPTSTFCCCCCCPACLALICENYVVVFFFFSLSLFLTFLFFFVVVVVCVCVYEFHVSSKR